MAASGPPSPTPENQAFHLNLQHGHKDLVQAIAFNTYGDRCATGSVDGKIRVFNRHRDGTWRLCDTWTAHGGEVLELQWLPATIYPNLVASLGIEGWFRLWAEDPSAAPGRRFCGAGRSSGGGRPAFDTRSTTRAPYRSFSMKHNDDTRQTHLALLATDGRLTIYENDQPDNLSEYTSIDDFAICPRPSRGEEVAFKVRFDPNPDPCYTALRAGVTLDALGLVVAGMDTVKVYRSRDVVTTSYGVPQTQREFYLAADMSSAQRGLVRDVAWAPGNIRGYDVIATACQDGFARVFRLETPYDENDGKSWSASHLLKTSKTHPGVGGSAGVASAASAAASASASATPAAAASASAATATALGGAAGRDAAAASGAGGPSPTKDETAATNTTAGTATTTIPNATTAEKRQPPSQQQQPSTLSASLAKSSGNQNSSERQWTGQEGQIQHAWRELSRLDSHRTPVWRVDFDDDGQILGSTGDDGRLILHRQTPDGSWAKSSELAMVKARMAAP